MLSVPYIAKILTMLDEWPKQTGPISGIETCAVRFRLFFLSLAEHLGDHFTTQGEVFYVELQSSYQSVNKY